MRLPHELTAEDFAGADSLEYQHDRWLDGVDAEYGCPAYDAMIATASELTGMVDDSDPNEDALTLGDHSNVLTAEQRLQVWQVGLDTIRAIEPAQV